MNKNQIFDPQSSILVVGDIMIDRYYDGQVRRISPEAPVPILNVKNEFDRAGGAANVAINIAKLGLDVTLVGYVGRDAASTALASMLDAAGVRFLPLVSATCPTIMKVRALSKSQQIIRIDFEKNFDGEDHRALADHVEMLIADVNLVVLSDYAKGTLQNAAEIIRICREKGKSVFVDPKGKDFEKYHGATMITPNLSEFEGVSGDFGDEDSFRQRAEQLRYRLGLQHLLVTRGEDGMSLFSEKNANLHIAADAREVYDVTGAGDTAMATLAAAYASGTTLGQAVSLANIAAGIVVAKTGTSTVSASEILARYAEAEQPTNNDPVAAIRAAQAAGHKIVMTNGCFDILHAGHVQYLEQAKRLGDKLVVAINSDASVTRLKGTARPINNLDDRVAILAALRCIDWVVPFDGSIDEDGNFQDTPLDIIRLIRPDVLVKGADYSISNIVGSADVLAWGGEVQVIPLLPGRSTTAAVKRLTDVCAKETSQ